MWPDLSIFCFLGKHLKPAASIILPKLSTLLGNFCKGVKIIHFSSEIIFGQLLWTFGDFLLVTLKAFNNPWCKSAILFCHIYVGYHGSTLANLSPAIRTTIPWVWWRRSGQESSRSVAASWPPCGRTWPPVTRSRGPCFPPAAWSINRPLVRLTLPTSVTRFTQISPLWQNVTSHWHFFQM